MSPVMPETSFSLSIWCSFRSIPSRAEASMVSSCCRFSLATLEFASSPATMSFALTECEHATAWRWAIINLEGLILDGGREPTRARARTTAEAALKFETA